MNVKKCLIGHSKWENILYDAVLFCLLLSLLREPARNRMVKERREEEDSGPGRQADLCSYFSSIVTGWLAVSVKLILSVSQVFSGINDNCY